MDTLSRDDAWRLELNAAALFGQDGSESINGLAQSVNDASKQFCSVWNIHNGASALDRVALHNCTVISEHHDTHVVCLQVEGHALQAAGEFHHFTSLHTFEAIDACDAITNAKHTADLLDILLVREVGNAVAEDPH